MYDKIEKYGKECKEEGRQEVLFDLVADRILTLEQAALKLRIPIDACKKSYNEYIETDILRHK